MSAFAEHVEATRRQDGSYDLAAAERSRAEELAESDRDLAILAAKAANAERKAYESANREHLKKVFSQPALSPELDLDAKVPLGGSVMARLGDMKEPAVRQRMDLRTRKHIDENDAYGKELDFWYGVLGNLPPGGTISDLAS